MIGIEHMFARCSSRLPFVGSLALVGVPGLVSLVARRFLGPLDGSSPAALLATYRRRFGVEVSLLNMTLFGGFFAGALTGRAQWMYVAAGIVALGLIRVAPSRRNLAADQAALRASGCTLSLIAVLRGQEVIGDQIPLVGRQTSG